MVVKDLRSLKYYELQKLAKSAGIKANQKIDKLIKALEAHYIETEDEIQEKKTPSSSANSRESRTATSGHKKTPTSVVGKKSPLAVLARKKTPATASNIGIKKGTPISTFGTRKPAITEKKQMLASAADAKKKTPNPSVESNQQPRKRRRTFELEEPTLSAANTPTAESQVVERKSNKVSKTNTPVGIDKPPQKRQRRGTYDKPESSPKDTCGSPGTTAMIASIDANQNSAERKNNLLSAINKKVQEKVKASPSTGANQPSQIPRFMVYFANMKKMDPTKPTAPVAASPSRNASQAPRHLEKDKASKPATPGGKNWTKIHSKEFSKFDSIDVYLEKKQQRKDLLSNSGKRPDRHPQPVKNSKIAKPVQRPQAASAKPFVPSVTSVKNLSFNFAKSPLNLQRNLSVTRSVKEFGLLNSAKTPKVNTPSVKDAKKSIASTNRTTPFKFKGASNANGPVQDMTFSATKKNTFDLKASLARPITWKPHTGKLQPLDVNTSVAVSRPSAPVVRGKTSLRSAHQSLASKSRPISTNPKDIRRVKAVDRRNNQKYVDMMRRRGLME